jgi:hypothetical protein
MRPEVSLNNVPSCMRCQFLTKDNILVDESPYLDDINWYILAEKNNNTTNIARTGETDYDLI